MGDVIVIDGRFIGIEKIAVIVPVHLIRIAQPCGWDGDGATVGCSGVVSFPCADKMIIQAGVKQSDINSNKKNDKKFQDIPAFCGSHG